MRRRSYLLVPLALAWLGASAQAGIFFSRTKKPAPAEQVADLAKTMRTDADERHRAAAADDLAKFDARVYPNAVNTLIESTLKDPSAAVRFEAAQSLGKVRPISAQSAYALEYALTNDPSTRVRSAAKSALWQYHVAGYRGTPAAPQTAEPGLASAMRPTAAAARPAPRPVSARPITEPPPVAAARTPAIAIPAPIDPPPYTAKPGQIKIGSSTPIDPPAAKPALAKPAAKPATPDDDGPILNPPM